MRGRDGGRSHAQQPMDRRLEELSDEPRLGQSALSCAWQSGSVSEHAGAAVPSGACVGERLSFARERECVCKSDISLSFSEQSSTPRVCLGTLRGVACVWYWSDGRRVACCQSDKGESVRCSGVRYKQHSVFLESFQVKCINRVACFFSRTESTVRISSEREMKVLFSLLYSVWINGKERKKRKRTRRKKKEKRKRTKKKIEKETP